MRFSSLPFSVSREILTFGLVGAVAAAVHVGVLIALVEWVAIRPLIANALAWIMALPVSFVGQRIFTFRPKQALHRTELIRFTLISAFGLGLNQVAYAVSLSWFADRYVLAWLPVVLLVAVATFLLSRHWVFQIRN